MRKQGLVLVHGLFAADKAEKSDKVRESRGRRAKMFAKFGDVLGVRDYEWVDVLNYASP